MIATGVYLSLAFNFVIVFPIPEHKTGPGVYMRLAIIWGNTVCEDKYVLDKYVLAKYTMME